MYIILYRSEIDGQPFERWARWSRKPYRSIRRAMQAKKDIEKWNEPWKIITDRNTYTLKYFFSIAHYYPPA